jgi:hypothetical protein
MPSLLVHRIEAENTTEIGKEEHLVSDNLGSKQQAGGEKRFDWKMPFRYWSN